MVLFLHSYFLFFLEKMQRSIRTYH